MKWSTYIESQMRSAGKQNPCFVGVTTPLAILFEALTCLRNYFYDRGWFKIRSLPGLVISIGNVAVGGTGKTPFTSLLVPEALQRGYFPIVISRGYGVKISVRDSWLLIGGKLSRRRQGIATASSDSVDLPDEARMLSEAFSEVPILCGPSRWQGARWYLRNHVAANQRLCWILDDGFQHRKLARQHDVVLLDEKQPLGNGWTLPRGYLRESAAGLLRATAFLITGENRSLSENEVGIRRPRFYMQASNYRFIPINDAAKNLTLGKSQLVVLVTGIARPERFRRSIQSLEMIPQREFFFRDHHQLTNEELAEIAGQKLPVVLTDKDYWRQPTDWESMVLPVFRLHVSWRVDPQLWNHLFGDSNQ